MGWSAEGAYDHEGWVANVLADGRVASSTTSGGVIVGELRPGDVAAGREVRRYAGSDAVEVVVPWSEVASWQLRCGCGWTGTSMPAYDTDARGWRDCPEELEDKLFHPRWIEHVAPHRALTTLQELAERAREIEEQITTQIGHARAGGASWAQIGAATGRTRQAAQQRWGHLTDAAG